MKKDTLPLSMDVREFDLATMAALIGGASGRAVQPAEAAALSRFIRIAQGDTGQSRRIADFKAIVRTWRPELAD